MTSIELEAVAAALPAYELEAELGSGAWGRVYGGTHRQLARPVAVKQLPPALAGDQEVRQRFVQEARLLASIEHPHIVPVYDFVDADGMCLLVMERLSGGTVWDRFVERGMDAGHACAVTLATAAALEQAHRRGVLHRDVKPENLMYSSDDVVKVTDFGIATVLGGDETVATSTGEVAGTPAYMAPEQAAGGPLGPPTDVYATGTLLYELLSGTLPFPDEGDAMALLDRKTSDDPVSLRDAAPGVPGAVADVVMQALARDPAERPQSADAFACALAAAAGDAYGTAWLDPTRIHLPATVTDALRAGGERSRTVTVTREGAAEHAVAAGTPPTGGDVVTRPREVAAHRRAEAGAGDVRPSELVPVDRLVRARGPSPRVPLLVSLVGAVAAVLVAFLWPQPEIDQAGAADQVLVAEQPLADTPSVDLDQPVPVVAPVPAGAVAEGLRVEVRLPFAGSVVATSPAIVADGRAAALIDLDGARFLAAGPVTAVVQTVGGAGATSVAEGRIEPDQGWRTIPVLVGVVLALAGIGSLESSLRGLRRRRRGPGALAGCAFAGGVVGVAVVLAAWWLGARAPSLAGSVFVVVLAALSGAAAGEAARRQGRRRR